MPRIRKRTKVKINITLDERLVDWLHESRGTLSLSAYINYLLVRAMEAKSE